MKHLFPNEKEFIFNLLGLENTNQSSMSRYRFLFEHIRKNALNDDGDIFEFGVFQGNTLIAIALLLKELGSDKLVYGFDSFNGFPGYSEYDELDCFNKYKDKYFNQEIIDDFEKSREILSKYLNKKKIDKTNISTTGEFNETSIQKVKERSELFELDNIRIIEGSFENSVPKFFSNFDGKISSVNIDCDLYDSYRIILPFLWEKLSKNGYMHLDEYFSLKFPGARIATIKFCEKMKITPKKNLTRPGEFERWYLTK
jgi:hypothetical protein